jgi:hypothetical protein
MHGRGGPRSGKSTYLMYRHQDIDAAVAVGPASLRWAQIVVATVHLRSDVRTLDDWATAVGKSRGALKSWCAAAGVSAKTSLDFARLLRTVVQYPGREWNPYDVLNVIDPRTLRRLLERTGGEFSTRRVPTLDGFLQMQQLITAPCLIIAVRQELARARTLPWLERTCFTAAITVVSACTVPGASWKTPNARFHKALGRAQNTG